VRRIITSPKLHAILFVGLLYHYGNDIAYALQLTAIELLNAISRFLAHFRIYW
jgi:hypothetical protein